MKKLSFLGVFVGGVVDVLGTSIMGLPFMVYVVASSGLAHASPDRITDAVMTAVHGNALLLVMNWLIGALGSAIGGYVAAWIAKRNYPINGAFSAWLCILSGVGSWLTGSVHASPLDHVMGIVLSPCFGALGGYLRLSLVRSKANTSVA